MGGYTGFSRFQKYNYFYVILVKTMDNYVAIIPGTLKMP